MLTCELPWPACLAARVAVCVPECSTSIAAQPCLVVLAAQFNTADGTQPLPCPAAGTMSPPTPAPCRCSLSSAAGAPASPAPTSCLRRAAAAAAGASAGCSSGHRLSARSFWAHLLAHKTPACLTWSAVLPFLQYKFMESEDTSVPSDP